MDGGTTSRRNEAADAAGLAELEARVRRDLGAIAWPDARWVKPRLCPDGEPMLNVLIVGAGQGGLTLGFQLMRDRVDRVAILDRAPPRDRGPWRTYGRMRTLRSPKHTTGPDLDIPSLTYQSFHEARHGAASWQALNKIPKEDWNDYLAWLERVLALPVRAGVEVVSVRPHADHVAVETRDAGGARTLYARHVVMATGIETPGRWWAPDFMAALPRERWSLSRDAIDFDALRGRTVAVLGAGASAFDNAAAALEAGAGAVHIFFRRPALQRVQPYKQISFAGFLRHFGDLDDATRWRFMRWLLTLREAFPAETHARVTRWPNAHLHPGAGWRGARVDGDGRVEIMTAKGPFACDHAIVAAGFRIDLADCPELAAVTPRAALWRDVYAPPAALRDARLGAYPYLDGAMALTARDPADAAALARVKLFNFGATASFGPSGASINALKFAAPRIAAGIARALFAEDAEAHYADLLAYDTPEF
jgi:cation diffusion facilitator CzcD-associated flavoprotein CzcO